MQQPKIDKAIFWTALIVIICLVSPLILFEEASKDFLGVLFAFATGQLGWSFLWFTIGSFFILAWLAIGRFGNVRFGEPSARPQFSLATATTTRPPTQRCGPGSTLFCSRNKGLQRPD